MIFKRKSDFQLEGVKRVRENEKQFAKKYQNTKMKE